MPMWVEKILKCNPGQKSLKSSLAIYFDLECLLKKEHQNDNLEESYTEKKQTWTFWLGNVYKKFICWKKKKKLIIAEENIVLKNCVTS